MKTLLINPDNTEFVGTGNTTPPLGLLYLVAELESKNLPVEMIDGCITGHKGIMRKIEEWKPDIVGVPMLSPCRHAAIDLIEDVHKKYPHIKIVAGNAHATSLPEQVMDNYPVDAVCCGEGEQWLSHYADTGDSVPGQYEDLDDINFPSWGSVNLRHYEWKSKNVKIGHSVSVVFSRGCAFTCNFCSTWHIWKTPAKSTKFKNYRVRSARNMVEELIWLRTKHDIRRFTFVDDAMTIDRDATLDLCGEICLHKELDDIKWLATTRVDCVDPYMLMLMKAAGCYKISYGVESAAPDIVKSIHKGVEPEEYAALCEEKINMTQDAGIDANVLMMVGNPDESDESIRLSKEFLKKVKPKTVGCTGSVWLLPMTALFQKAKREGIIDDDFWLTKTPMMSWPHKPRQLRKWYRQLLSYSRYFWWRNLLATYYPRATIGRFLRKLWLFRNFGIQVGRVKLTKGQMQ